MSVTKQFLLGSAKEPPTEVDRLLGLQDVVKRNAECEHVVTVGPNGPAQLALKMRGSDLCPHCTRREAAYWRVRAKTAEGSDRRLTKAEAAGRNLAATLSPGPDGLMAGPGEVAAALADARKMGWIK